MESVRITPVEDWPTVMSLKNDQVLVGYTNFYRSFIQQFAKVTIPLTELQMKLETYCGKQSGASAESGWTQQAELAFRTKKGTCTESPILQDFDPAKLSILQMDAR
jgi:hypothetical protein